MSSIYDWSKVAANNATSDSLINWAEGMPPSAVNNSARQLEARVAEYLGDTAGALTAGGTANAQTVTANSAFIAYANGLVLVLKIATSNTTAATLNVNGLGAKSFRKMLGTGESALVGGELQAAGIYMLTYSTALNAAAGGWLVLNPSNPNVLGPATSTDNALVRFDGATGQLVQNSGIIVDDSNNVGGVVALAATGNITSGANFISSSASVVLANNGAAAGNVVLRPNGAGSTTGQTVLSSAGNMTVAGDVTSGTNFVSSTTNVVLAPTGAGAVILRPNGSGSTTGQLVVSSTGAATINGTLNATSGSNTVQMDSAGRWLVGGPAYTGTVITAIGCSIQGPGATSPGAISSTVQSSACVFLNRQGGDGTITEFYRAGSFVGSVSVSAGATAYNTSSDARLKKNFRPFDSGSIIDALEFGQFEWIDSGKTAFGVLAQDAERAFPEAVSVSDNGTYQVDYSKYIPAIMAELKDIRRRLSAAGL